MLKNYLLIAWRQLLKNRLYASINIAGLVVGLSVYVFGSLLVAYERSHDAFWANSDRIFTAGSVFSPTAGVGVGETDGIYTAFAPLIAADVPEIEEVARTVRKEFLLTIGDDNYYEGMHFADPAFMRIFDFEFIEGDATALDDPLAVMLSRETSEKFFGTGTALGRSITLDHDVTLRVSAVFEDLPVASHFNSSIFGGGGLHVVAPLAALNRADGYDLAGNFSNLSSGHFTYMLLPEGKDRDWLQVRLDGVYDAHFPETDREFVVGMKVRPLTEANTIIWDAVGIPALDSVRILAFLVLVVACVNYTNLATAQSLGRAREVGLRKTMGAEPRQLLAQFLVESVCIATIAMVVTVALLELVVPLFNEALDKDLAIDYVDILPWLVATTACVGLVAGAYPAWLITRASPLAALRDGGGSGARGNGFRNTMLGLQFAISIFMLAMVMVVYFQNVKVEQASNIYPRGQILTLQRLGLESIQARMDTLRNELSAIPGVEAVSFSSHVPYEQSNSGMDVSTTRGDRDSAVMVSQIQIDEHFLATYDIPLVAGRALGVEIGEDTRREGGLAFNVIVNELALEQLGFSGPQDALGGQFYDFREGEESRTYTIVGVVPSQNFRGFHNQINPTVFLRTPASFQTASIRIVGVPMQAALTDVEAVWDQLVPEYPMQSEFLDETFANVFGIYRAMTVVLGGFAAVALTLSFIGLFGLAAFMAQKRTREIGLRKVMGASLLQIVRLLIWQFSKPVLWALLVALPLSYFASDTYLGFFADRLAMPAGIVALAGTLAVIFAWCIVAIHAVRIGRANPIDALRYE